MYLSYSGYKTFDACRRSYWHGYIDKSKLSKPENKVNSLYGTVVGTLFESFYSDKLWRRPDVDHFLQAQAPEHLRGAVQRESRKNTIQWKVDDPRANYAGPEALLVDVVATIPRGLRTIKQHRLLGPQQAEAEVKLDHEISGHMIGGRADFIIRRSAPYSDLVLLDGKGSKWRDKYVDPRQLKWYAMLHKIKYGFAPDRLGFVFWRFESEQAVDWVSSTATDLDTIQEMAVRAASQIATSTERESYPASPGGGCKLCAFLELCSEGQRFLTLKVPIPEGVPDEAGVEDVGF